jgi:PIN domain nuclease of toxin-antitoxin system
VIHLDTHVVVWLVAGLVDKVPPAVLDRIERDDVAISPMVRLELTYLHEINRLRHGADEIIARLRRATAAVEDPTPFGDVAAVAATVTWTRDPFDRLIAAQAVAARCHLATADRSIRGAVPEHTVWS